MIKFVLIRWSLTLMDGNEMRVSNVMCVVVFFSSSLITFRLVTSLSEMAIITAVFSGLSLIPLTQAATSQHLCGQSKKKKKKKKKIGNLQCI